MELIRHHRAPHGRDIINAKTGFKAYYQYWFDGEKKVKKANFANGG